MHNAKSTRYVRTSRLAEELNFARLRQQPVKAAHEAD
ncbi:hypothetical protein JHX88_21755 (plasmid) [Paracoccus saliphilus]|uniref:Transposase n=1 Tax=Paracoccus saliphilus TaxID=405559 RepID=A0ABY7SEN2_9RHOB|nr:hypothetical protein JHX88_21755 [Paracoccus saliphilus]